MIRHLIGTITATYLLIGFAPEYLHAGTTSQVYGSTLTKQTQTMYVRAEAGWTTYNSEASASNATVATTAAALGLFAGENRRVGLILKHADYEVPFELNNTTARHRYYDMKMQARFGFFYPSISVSQMELSLNSNGPSAQNGNSADAQLEVVESITNLFGNAYGAGMGVYFPLTNSIVIHADYSHLRGTNESDKSGKEVKVKTRQDVEVAATADLIQNLLDLSVGYQQRRYNIEIEEKGYNEVLSTPFAAMQMGIYF